MAFGLPDQFARTGSQGGRTAEMGHYTSVSMTLAFYDVPAGATGIER